MVDIRGRSSGSIFGVDIRGRYPERGPAPARMARGRPRRKFARIPGNRRHFPPSPPRDRFPVSLSGDSSRQRGLRLARGARAHRGGSLRVRQPVLAHGAALRRFPDHGAVADRSQRPVLLDRRAVLHGGLVLDGAGAAADRRARTLPPGAVGQSRDGGDEDPRADHRRDAIGDFAAVRHRARRGAARPSPSRGRSRPARWGSWPASS